MTIFAIIGEFLIDLKQEFSRGDNKTIKVAELKKIEQESKTIESLYRSLREQQKEMNMKEDYWLRSLREGSTELFRGSW